MSSTCVLNSSQDIAGFYSKLLTYTACKSTSVWKKAWNIEKYLMHQPILSLLVWTGHNVWAPFSVNQAPHAFTTVVWYCWVLTQFSLRIWVSNYAYHLMIANLFYLSYLCTLHADVWSPSWGSLLYLWPQGQLKHLPSTDKGHHTKTKEPVTHLPNVVCTVIQVRRISLCTFEGILILSYVDQKDAALFAQ